MNTRFLAMAALGGVFVLAAAAPASADRDDWRRREWRAHEWREHHRRPVYYAPPPVYYARPPAYYPPPAVYYPPPVINFGFSPR